MTDNNDKDELSTEYFDLPVEDNPIGDDSTGDQHRDEQEFHDEEVLTQDQHNEIRQAKAWMLKNTLVYKEEHPIIFKTISLHEDNVRDYFSETFLTLKHDTVGEFYILIPEDTETPHVSLIPRKALTLQDSIVLVFLRKFHLDQDIAGISHPKIHIDDVFSGVQALLPESNSRSADMKRVRNAMQNFITRRFVKRVRGDDDSFIITPVLRYILDADEMLHILNSLRVMAHTEGVVVEQRDQEDANA